MVLEQTEEITREERERANAWMEAYKRLAKSYEDELPNDDSGGSSNLCCCDWEPGWPHKEYCFRVLIVE